MLQETSRCAVSASLVGGPDRDPRRLRLATDLWSEDEHLLQQDESVCWAMALNPEFITLTTELYMADVLNVVAEVASEGPTCSTKFQLYMNALRLEKDPALMKLIG